MHCAGDQVYSPREKGSALSLGAIGTRRTVYLSDDDPPPTATTKNQPNSTSSPSNTTPLLVYNRISTVINEVPRNPNAQSVNVNEESNTRDAPTERKKNENSKDNAIWYEYGCV